MDLLAVLDSAKVHLEKSQDLINGICLEIGRFLLNEELCKKCIKIVFSRLNDEEGTMIYIISN